MAIRRAKEISTLSCLDIHVGVPVFVSRNFAVLEKRGGRKVHRGMDQGVGVAKSAAEAPDLSREAPEGLMSYGGW